MLIQTVKKRKDSNYLSSIIRIVARYTLVKRKEITPKSRLCEDLGITSLDTVSIISEIEKQFCVTVSVWEDIRKIETVSDIVEYIIKLKTGGTGVA